MLLRYTSIIALAFACSPCLLSAQWSHTPGPPGMTTTRMMESNGALFVGTEMKGVYKSVNGGVDWTPSNSGIENEFVMSLAQDATYLYAGTLASGVYRSADGGASWLPANNGIGTVAAKCMLVAAGHLWVGAIGGVWRSPDQGDTWINASGGALTFSMIFDMVYRAPRIVVEADNYIFYSTDLGDSWFVDQGSTSFYVIKNFMQKGDTVLAADDTHVFRSFDGTVNWSNAVEVYPDIHIAGLARKESVIYAGYADGVYRSDNWGQSWIQIPSTGLRFGNRQVNDFKISNGVFLLSFEEIGVFRSLDEGVTWTQAQSGFGAHSGIDNCLTVTGSTVISGTHSNGVFRSTDNGDTWQKIGTPSILDTLSNGTVFATLRPQPGVLLAGTCGYGLYRSANDGATWTHITNGLPFDASLGFSCINALALAGSNIVATTTEGIYYSTNMGITWNASSLTGVYAGGLAANGSVLCAGISAGSPTGVYRSTNSGVSWQLAATIPDVITMCSDGLDHFYAGSFDGNYRSTNNGMSWNVVGPGIPSGEGGYSALAMGEHVFIGNGSGVYHSDDYGASFASVSDGLDPGMNRAVQGLASNDEFIFAGLHRNGVWRRALSDFDITTRVNELFGRPIMSVWPSPTASTIHVRLNLRHSDRVRLQVFDASGQLVRTLDEENMSAGLQERTFELDELAPGAYVVHMNSATEHLTAPIHIMR